MMQSQESNRRPTIAAAMAASCLMLVFGLAYRVLAARLEAPVNTTPLSSEALMRLPLQIGAWRGEEIPMDDEIMQATDADAVLNRRYIRHDSLETVSLYLASGVKARDLMPHRPEVCYTGAGWTLTGRQSAELSLSGAAKLPCNILQFSRGALTTEKIMVLDYYLVDGQYCADVSLLRSKAWRGSGTVRYVAQIQVMTPVGAIFDTEAAIQTVSDFAVESALLTAALFDDRQTGRAGDEIHQPAKGW